MTEVARITPASPYRGTIAVLAAYIRDIEGFVAPKACVGGERTGKS
jgi:hypothetical protein